MAGKLFSCGLCSKGFSGNNELKRHIRSVHEKSSFRCSICGAFYSRHDSLARHMKSHNEIKDPKKVQIPSPTHPQSYLDLSTPQPSTSNAQHQFENSEISRGKIGGFNTLLEALRAGTVPIIGKSLHIESIVRDCFDCNVEVPENLWNHHIKSDQHISNARKTNRLSEVALPSRYCYFCRINVEERRWLHHLRTERHRSNTARPSQFNGMSLIKSACQDRIQSVAWANTCSSELDVSKILNNAKSDIASFLSVMLAKHDSIKFNLELFGNFIIPLKHQDDDKDTVKKDKKSFTTKMTVLTNDEEIDSVLNKQMDDVLTKMHTFEDSGSGWTCINILRLEINVNRYTPLKGGSYIELPKIIQKRKACINIKNNDVYCFKWAVISAFFQSNGANHLDRPSTYNVARIEEDIILLNDRSLNFTGLQFPLLPRDIKKFEALNTDISVNVFGFNDTTNCIIGPYYSSRVEKGIHINLLLIQKEIGIGICSHYTLIKNMSRLIGKQITAHAHRMHICNGCLQSFGRKDLLEQHKQQCAYIVTKMPEEGKNTINFNDFQRMFDVPFAIYADCESILKRMQTCDPNSVGSSSHIVNEHQACAFSYIIKCSYNNSYNRFKLVKGEDAAKQFVDSLVSDVKDLYHTHLASSTHKPMIPLTYDENRQFDSSTLCHLCAKPLKDDKVRDHCHFTGRYRGAAHKNCNLKFAVPKFFPVFFHNFSGYDCHLFIKELNNIEGPISLIPLNKELYISASKRIKVTDTETIEIRFLDSLRFMPSSLDSLAKNLDSANFESVRSVFGIGEKFEISKRKAVFCYEYLDSFEKLLDVELPSREQFYSSLSEKDCSIEDYEHAQNAYRVFRCKNLGDYLEVYLTIDVLILADVFENFRKVCKKIYRLDPCHYYTAAGLAWDACMKVTKIELDLIKDIDMHQFIQNGIRGGIVQCSKRHAVANNKFTNFDSSKPSEYIVYLDANNLYGWAMSQPLPYANFEWFNVDESFDITKVPKDSDTGYILEVDLEYPHELHNNHNDLPFCVENKSYGVSKNKKLIPNLDNKRKYTIHYIYLQQCIKHGLKLEKIHRVLKFSQKPWLKDYIDLNTDHRRKAKSEFEKNFFKLMNNAVFGKTMENVDKRKDVKLVSSWESSGKHLGARALIAKPNFHSISIFDSNLIAIQLDRVQTYYDKPIYLGLSVLDLSKYLMYKFHYDYMKPKYMNRLKLNYMDTDSFIYSIFTDDYYHDIKDDVNLYFDTSEYPPDNEYGIPLVNGKKLGMMKDEACGRIVKEFVGLRSKMYCIDVKDKPIIMKCKGVKKTVINRLSIDNYRDCLYNEKIYYGTCKMFRSNQHNVYTTNVNKVALSYADDKRHILQDKINTLAWGHKDLTIVIDDD